MLRYRLTLVEKMKALICRLNHETNTFAPGVTPLSAFGIDGPEYGRTAYESQRNAPTAMGAFLELAESWDWEIVTPISAMANPSGIVELSAYDHMCNKIIDAAQDCDVLLLDLHGAMIAEGVQDGEGELLQKRSEEHTSELQSLMRSSYAVFCLKKKKKT